MSLALVGTASTPGQGGKSGKSKKSSKKKKKKQPSAGQQKDPPSPPSEGAAGAGNQETENQCDPDEPSLVHGSGSFQMLQEVGWSALHESAALAPGRHELCTLNPEFSTIYVTVFNGSFAIICCLPQNIKVDNQVDQLTEKLIAVNIHEEPMVAQSYNKTTAAQEQPFSGVQLPLPIIPSVPSVKTKWCIPVQSLRLPIP